MAEINQNFSVGLSNSKSSVKTQDIDAQIQELSSSLPEVTTTKEQKEKAIKIKEQIIVLKMKQLQMANQENNVSLATSIKTSIKMLEEEKNIIKGELAGMVNVFSANHVPDNSDVSIFNKK